MKALDLTRLTDAELLARYRDPANSLEFSFAAEELERRLRRDGNWLVLNDAVYLARDGGGIEVVSIVRLAQSNGQPMKNQLTRRGANVGRSAALSTRDESRRTRSTIHDDADR